MSELPEAPAYPVVRGLDPSPPDPGPCPEFLCQCGKPGNDWCDGPCRLPVCEDCWKKIGDKVFCPECVAEMVEAA